MTSSGDFQNSHFRYIGCFQNYLVGILSSLISGPSRRANAKKPSLVSEETGLPHYLVRSLGRFPTNSCGDALKSSPIRGDSLLVMDENVNFLFFDESC